MKPIKMIIVVILLFAGCKKEALFNQIEPEDLLSSKKYSKLIVEIQYTPGCAPTDQTINDITTFLRERLNKPAGISIVKNSISSPGKSSYSIDDLKEIEKRNRTQHTNERTVTIYIFFADAEYAGNSGNSKVLGVAYDNTSIAIFQKTVIDHSGGITQPPRSTLETTVIDHELGHLMGLVNNGTDMQASHQDHAHGKHCNDSNCLMYYTAETTDIVSNLLGGNVPALDANCIHDLQANGGR